MTEGKYARNYITQMKPNFQQNRHIKEGMVNPDNRKIRANPMAYVDNEVIEGGFYSENVWFLQGDDEIAVGPHKHDWDELLTFWGSDPDNPDDLCGEIELWLDGEKHILTKSGAMFIPKGVQHCPLIIRRVDRPIFHYAVGYTPIYNEGSHS